MSVDLARPAVRPERCERCGRPGFLALNSDTVQRPAWCVDCHEAAGTSQAAAGHPCRDGCRLSTDHDGLCHL